MLEKCFSLSLSLTVYTFLDASCSLMIIVLWLFVPSRRFCLACCSWCFLLLLLIHKMFASLLVTFTLFYRFFPAQRKYIFFSLPPTLAFTWARSLFLARVFFLGPSELVLYLQNMNYICRLYNDVISVSRNHVVVFVVNRMHGNFLIWLEISPWCVGRCDVREVGGLGCWMYYDNDDVQFAGENEKKTKCS